MTAIWASDESGWHLLSAAGFPDEATLHDLIEQAPELLPLSGTPTLAVLGREVQLGTGYADLVAVEPSGRMVLIEVKLAKNAEARRAIVSQILAYAAFLQGITPEELESSVLPSHLSKRGANTVAQAASASHQEGQLDHVAFTDGLASSLESGWFRLVLVLDEAPAELVRLIGYLERITGELVIDLITVRAYDVDGTKVIVPQRVDPEHASTERAPTRAASPTEKGFLVQGADDWLAAAAEGDPKFREETERLGHWAIELAASGQVTLGTYHGTGMMTLLPRLRDSNVGLVSVILDGSGSYLTLFRSVFERRSPHSVGAVESLLPAGTTLGQGTGLRDPGQEILDAIAAAYREAVTPNDVVVVAAKNAYPEYLKYDTYFCQVGRGFREGLERFGFYTEKEIKPVFPKILYRKLKVELSADGIAELRASGHQQDSALADVVERLLQDESARSGEENQVFLLSPLDSDSTLHLDAPIRHEKPTAWVQQHRYTRTELLETGPTTTDQLDPG